MGVPVGSDLEYADEVTMHKAHGRPARGLTRRDAAARPTSFPPRLLLVLGGALSPALPAIGCSGSCWRSTASSLGAMLASSMMGSQQHDRHDRGRARRRHRRRGRAAVFAYFVGIALVGAGLGALVAHVGVERRSRTAIRRRSLIVVLCGRSGAIGAMMLQRYVIIVATAFGGAWTVIVGGAGARGDRGAAQRGVGRATCGFCIRSRRRRGSHGCRSRGSCSA